MSASSHPHLPKSSSDQASSPGELVRHAVVSQGSSVSSEPAESADALESVGAALPFDPTKTGVKDQSANPIATGEPENLRASLQEHQSRARADRPRAPAKPSGSSGRPASSRRETPKIGHESAVPSSSTRQLAPAREHGRAGTIAKMQGDGESRLAPAVLRHLGWWELCEHYRTGLRSSAAQSLIAADIDWLMGGAPGQPVLAKPERGLVLDPDRKVADSIARLDELDGLELIAAFDQPDLQDAGPTRVHGGRPIWPMPSLLPALADLEDLGASLKAASSGELFSIVEMVGVRACLHAARQLQAALSRVQELCAKGLPPGSWGDEVAAKRGVAALRRRLARPGMHESDDGGIAPNLSLLAELERCIDPSGDGDSNGPTLADSASPALTQARQDLRRRKAALIARAEEYVRRSDMATMLQDRYWTEREGRVVLPLRSDAMGALRDGTSIIHGASQTGQTLFVEPRELVTSNNEVRQAEMRVRAEEHRILTALTQAIVGDAPRIVAIQRALIQLDFVAARLRLSERLQARRPELFDPGERTATGERATGAGQDLELIGARHPLMVLRGLDVVENDLRVPSGSALVITGPNAGGKTVALKTFGLCILMARAGLRIPTERTGKLGAFLRVVTDVGDDQSIAANLSTFSAHISHVCAALHHAQQDGPRTLALFDEIAVGTDPEQGAALAESILLELVRLGATVLVTTHYDRLKLLATRATGPMLGAFHNAAVGFDLEQMKPTFRLTLGVPGSSSALAVARRLGVPHRVLDQAERLMGSRHRDMERLLVTLDDERRRLQVLRDELQTKERKLDGKERELAGREHKLEEQKKLRQQKAADAATEALWALEEELSLQRKALRRQGLDPDAHLPTKDRLVGPARAQIEAHRQREAAQYDAVAPALAVAVVTPLQVGESVRLRSLGTEGEVLAIKGDKVTVQLPLLRTTVDADEIERIVAAPAKANKVRRTTSAPIKTWAKSDAAKYFGSEPQKAPSNLDTCIDLRGQRADDALALLELALDEAMLQGREVVVVLHGHGTGELRRLVRLRLRELAHVHEFRPGIPAEGGDAVTVVWVDA